VVFQESYPWKPCSVISWFPGINLSMATCFPICFLETAHMSQYFQHAMSSKIVIPQISLSTLNIRWMESSGELHIPTVLLLENMSFTVPLWYDAGWAWNSVWVLWREELLCLWREWSTDIPVLRSPSGLCSTKPDSYRSRPVGRSLSDNWIHPMSYVTSQTLA
jgi:hypothetical protein